MQTTQKRGSSVSTAFIILLFIFYLFAALSTVLIGTSVYRNIVSEMDTNSKVRTTLSYFSEKIHQNDNGEAIHIETIDDQSVLVIPQTYNEKAYNTYLYIYNQDLMELLIQDGQDFSLSQGNVILSDTNCQMAALDEHLFQFTVTDKDNQTHQVLVSTQSQS
ncbi:MAG: DUF4860 domain-containing protein [Lachnospiraceae bacterium]|nr:DUF4860 domain-containing protein [Lachnospiraceae bacterium]MDD3615753.1 DUF4860 domain-containing protein [Lachnospiraceae bacterium]